MPSRKFTDKHPIRTFDGAPHAGNTLAVWSGFIADLLKKHGPHARLVLDAGANNVSAEVQVDRIVRESYVAPRPKFKNVSLEKFKDLKWAKLLVSEQRRLTANRAALAQWEAKVTSDFVALQAPKVPKVRRPVSVIG